MSLHKHLICIAAAGARPVFRSLWSNTQGSEHAMDLHRQVMAALKKLNKGENVVAPDKHIPTPYMKVRPSV